MFFQKTTLIDKFITIENLAYFILESLFPTWRMELWIQFIDLPNYILHYNI